MEKIKTDNLVKFICLVTFFILLQYFLVIEVKAQNYSTISNNNKINLYDLSEDEQKQYNIIASKIFCPVCNGETVITSSAPVAIDMRNKIISSIRDGKTPKEIELELIKIYGKTIIDRPVNFSAYLILYFFPFCFCLYLLYFLIKLIRKNF